MDWVNDLAPHWHWLAIGLLLAAAEMAAPGVFLIWLAMAAIVATIDAMKEEKVVENAASIGNEVLRPGLEALAEKHAIIGEVRGRGLFQALELVSSREQKTPLTAADMAALKWALTEAGLLAFVVENRIHVVPPCTITAEQVAQGLAIFDAVFARFASLAK